MRRSLNIGHAAETRFLEPDQGQPKIVSRNREFEKSKVVSNDGKLLMYCFVRGDYVHETNPGETTVDLSYQEVQETEGSRNCESTV